MDPREVNLVGLRATAISDVDVLDAMLLQTSFTGRYVDLLTILELWRNDRDAMDVRR